MQILGYIITKHKIKNLLPCIKIVGSIKSVDKKNLPILIIGLEEARKNASSFSILNKQFDENKFWTFSKYEKRNDFEKDVERFQEYVLQYALQQIKYHYVNVLTIKWNKMKALLSLIKENGDKTFYLNQKMVYMFNQNYVIGVSFDILDYIGVNRKKIIKLITSNQTNKVFFNNFQIDYKIKNIISNKQYAIPFFLSLKER